MIPKFGFPDPQESLRAGLEVGHLLVEVQMVVSMRVLGAVGLWSVSPRESERMVTEKLLALVAAFEALQRSAWRGERIDQMATAALRPIRRRTYANSRRLSRRGPRPVQLWQTPQ